MTHNSGDPGSRKRLQRDDDDLPIPMPDTGSEAGLPTPSGDIPTQPPLSPEESAAVRKRLDEHAE